MRKVMLAAAVAMAFGFSVAAQADGAALYAEKGCVTCHGADAKSPTVPLYPKLAGQSVEYLMTQMKDIKAGTRANGMSAAMVPFISQVSDAEMTEIATWVAAQ